MSKTHLRALSVTVAVLVVSVAMSVVACEPLTPTTTTVAPTTTETTVEQTTTTTEAAPPAVDVTMESGTSYCLVDSTFSEGGVDYVVVDYIQLDKIWFKNTNPKLRTFRVTEETEFWWPSDPGQYDYHDSVNREVPPRTFEGLQSIPRIAPHDFEYYDGSGNHVSKYNIWIGAGYWKIKVSDGEVVRLETVAF